MRIKRQILYPALILIVILGVWCGASDARTYNAQIQANSDDFMPGQFPFCENHDPPIRNFSLKSAIERVGS